MIRFFTHLIACFGALAIFSPSPLHAQCPLLYTFDGEKEGDRLGNQTALVGDIDDDGCDDILVGVGGYRLPNNPAYLGKVYLYSGATGEILRSWLGEGGLGFAVAGAGDVDGDGTPDLIVGAHPYGLGTPFGQFSGKVYLYSGATGALIWSWNGDRINDQFGWSVAGPGDLNGDGHADIVVGQKGHDGTSDFAGKVYAYSGADGSLLWSRAGDALGDQLGWSVSGAGDFNHDGYPDVVASAPGHENYVYVFSGHAGETIQLIPYWDNTDPTDGFGLSLSGIGDVNGDGFDDIVVGAYEAGGATWSSGNGQAYVLLGPDGRRHWTWTGENPGDFLGRSVAGVGDVDGDWVPDVAVGAYGHWGSTGYASGRAYVFSGATSQLIQSWDGEHSGDFFGLSVGGRGDADGDGLNDVLVATYFAAPNGYVSGRAYLFTPALSGPCDCYGRIELDFYYWQVGCMAGPARPTSSLCTCPDFDQDGYMDMTDFAELQYRFGGRY